MAFAVLNIVRMSHAKGQHISSINLCSAYPGAIKRGTRLILNKYVSISKEPETIVTLLAYKSGFNSENYTTAPLLKAYKKKIKELAIHFS